MINVVTIDYWDISGKEVVHTNLQGEETLLDADVVVIDPSQFSDLWQNDTFSWDDGIARARSPLSDRIRRIFKTRQKEIETLLENGKIIVSFLEPLEGFLGEINGDARYEAVTNYDLFPINRKFLIDSIKKGSSNSSDSIRHSKGQTIFSQYFHAFKGNLKYRAYFDINNKGGDEFFLVNRSNKPVGACLSVLNGIVIFVPPFDDEKGSAKFLGIILKAAKTYFKKDISTPPPNWVENYQLPGEQELSKKIESITQKVEQLTVEKEKVEDSKSEISKFKGLLFEQGKPLEQLVIEAFQHLGFTAENRTKDDLEHDIVFQSKEGRGLAEVEGKDNDAVHIGKLDQLNRAVDEDFAINNDYPQGVLIGNHYRFTTPDKRKEPFTDKVKIVAEKKSFGLLTTLELYNAMEEVLKAPKDEAYKEFCRNKILKTTGRIIELKRT